MAELSNLASTAVEKKHVKSRAKWIAEVEINLMSKVFAVPKKGEGGKTVQGQQKELCEQCAALIATNLMDLAKLGNTCISCMQLKRESTLMQLVWKYVDDPASFPASEKKEGKHNSVVTEQLVPKVIEMDADGRPTSHHETVPLRTPAVETIPWSTWADRETKRNPNNTAKLLLSMAIDSLHQNWNTPAPLRW